MGWGEKIALVWKRLAFDLLATRARFQCGFAGPLLVVDDVAVLVQLGGRSGWAAFEPLGGDYLIHESSLEPDAWKHCRKLLLVARATRPRRVALRLIRRAVRREVRSGKWRYESRHAESRWSRLTLMGLLWIMGAVATHFLVLIAIKQWSVFRGHSIAAALTATGVVLLLVLALHLCFAMGRVQLSGRFAQRVIADEQGMQLVDDLGREYDTPWAEVAFLDTRYRSTIRLRTGESFVLPLSMRLRTALAEVSQFHGIPTVKYKRLTLLGAAARIIGLSVVPGLVVYVGLSNLPGPARGGPPPAWAAFVFGIVGLFAGAALVWDRKRSDKMR